MNGGLHPSRRLGLGPVVAWVLYEVLLPVGGAYAPMGALNVHAIVEGVGKVGVVATLRAPADEANGGQDVAVRLLGAVAASAAIQAPCNAFRTSREVYSVRMQRKTSRGPRNSRAAAPHRPVSRNFLQVPSAIALVTSRLTGTS